MADSGTGHKKAPARWVLFLLVTGLACLVLGHELRFQLSQITRKKDLGAWQDLNGQKWDPNTATLGELELVPGLGPKLAKNIIEARKENHFHSLEDLGKIKGFGPQRLSLMEPWLQFQDSPLPVPPKNMPLIGQLDTNGSGNETRLPKPLDPNQASAEELESIPGIGPKLARKIMAEREIKKFATFEDLVRVQGIGPKNIEKLRPFLAVQP